MNTLHSLGRKLGAAPVFQALSALQKWAYILLLGAAFCAAGGLKIWLVAGGVVPFNSDEAIVALMARHILQGHLPAFFYGQAYMGSLDALLVAPGFALFGEQVWVIRLVQGLLYLGILASTVRLGQMAFPSPWTGVVAALLLAVPTVNVTLYTTASLGGYGEALLLGNLILLVGLRLIKNMDAKDMDASSPGAGRWQWLIWGFFAGVGLWAFGITLIYSLPVGACLAWRVWRRYRQSAGGRPPAAGEWRLVAGAAGQVLLGGLLGAAPWWLYAFQYGFAALVRELGGGAIAGVERLSWLWQVLQHMYSLILLGSTAIFGFRPPWNVQWLALPLLPFVLLFWMAVIVYIISLADKKDRPGHTARGLLLAVMLTLILGFIFTPFGADPSGRYFLPLAVPLALFAADMILSLREQIGRLAFGLIALLLAYNLWGTVQVANKFPPGVTTQFNEITQVDHSYMDELSVFLRQNGETRGYTNYWVSYPLAFSSQEELIFIPRLPYHKDFRYTERDDRYAPYDRLVAQSERVAYITTRHEPLNTYLRRQFTALGVGWQETRIGEYQVFYALTDKVTPAEIGLGSNSDGMKVKADETDQ